MPERLLILILRNAAIFMLVVAAALIIVRWKFPKRNDRVRARVSPWRDAWESWLESRKMARERNANLSALRKKTVLVVDPDEKSARVLAWQLGNLGCKVISVRKGSKGLNYIRKQQPALIIADALLPDISAVDFYRALNNMELPILFIGVVRDQWDELHHLGTNVACFAKPYDVEDTLVLAGQMLRKRR